MTFVDQKNDFV